MAIQEITKKEVKIVAGGQALRKLQVGTATPRYLSEKSLKVGHVDEKKSSLHNSKKSRS